MQDVDLMDKIDTISSQLSGGQMRKLSVAIALIGDPKVSDFIIVFIMIITYMLVIEKRKYYVNII